LVLEEEAQVGGEADGVERRGEEAGAAAAGEAAGAGPKIFEKKFVRYQPRSHTRHFFGTD